MGVLGRRMEGTEKRISDPEDTTIAEQTTEFTLFLRKETNQEQSNAFEILKQGSANHGLWA